MALTSPLSLFRSTHPVRVALAVCGLSGLFGLHASAQAQECLGDASARPVLKVAVVPQIPPAEIHAVWSPLLDKLGKDGHWCFNLTLSRSIPDFENELLEGKPDLAFMNPYHQVMAHRRQGYRPLVADAQLLTGIVVVRKDSGLQKLEDLKGKAIAYPAPNAFAATLLTRAILAQRGIETTPVFVKTHSNVYRSVQQSDTAAGAGVNNTLMRELPGLQQELKVLFETPGFRAHPLSAHPRLPAQTQTAIRQAFIALAKSAEGSQLLDKAQLPQPQPVDHARDYQPLEKLGLQAFVQNAK